ncbi:MAG: PKD domain-containing protein, partial [Bacteroidales bacterium]|nr:PKD domain-containing protein [Bacteroidales bacterium]
GESFSIRAAGTAPGEHIQGIHVTSDKNIAIMIYDDSMRMADGGSWDIFMDQLVPTSLVGLEYVVLKGNIQVASPSGDTESIFFTATQNNTQIYIDGAHSTTLAQKGDYYEYRILNNATHVRCTKPTYVNHITGYGNTSSRELGGAILPAIDNCTGSHTVTVKRSEDPASYGFFMNLMVRNDTTDGSPNKNKAIENFTYSVNNGSPQTIPASHFTYIMDSAFVYYDKDKATGSAFYQSPRVVDGDIVRVDNPISRFHLGIMQGNETGGCKYGYFSGYATEGPSAGINGAYSDHWNNFCKLDTVRLCATGATSYNWFPTLSGADSLMNYISDAKASCPKFYPKNYGSYQWSVELKGECFNTDTIQLEVHFTEQPKPSFTIKDTLKCNETDAGIEMTWKSYSEDNHFHWDFGDGTECVKPNPVKDYAGYEVDTNFTIELMVVNEYGCDSMVSKDIHIRSNVIKAEITMEDTAGCEPAVASFNAASSRGSDIIQWEGFEYDTQNQFTTHKDSSISVVFHNFSAEEARIVSITAIVNKDNLCYDTAVRTFYVYPNPQASFITNPRQGISPLQVEFTNYTKGKNLSYEWDFGNGKVSTEENPTMEFTADDKTDYDIKLIVNNKYGCSSTLVDQVTVFPHSSISQSSIGYINTYYNNKHNELVIDLSACNAGSNISMKLMDINGQVYLHETNLLNTSYVTSTSLRSGTYVVLINVDGQRYNQKIVVQ